jgi:hypothetical protein
MPRSEALLCWAKSALLAKDGKYELYKTSDRFDSSSRNPQRLEQVDHSWILDVVTQLHLSTRSFKISFRASNFAASSGPVL